MPYANICVCFVFCVSCVLPGCFKHQDCKKSEFCWSWKACQEEDFQKTGSLCGDGTGRFPQWNPPCMVYGKRAPKIGQPETEIHVQIHELVLIVQEPHSMTRGVRVGLNVLDSTVVVKVYVRSLFIRESFYCPQGFPDWCYDQTVSKMVCFARGIYFQELDSVDIGWGAWVCCELKPRPQLPPGKKPRCTKGQRSLVNP